MSDKNNTGAKDRNLSKKGAEFLRNFRKSPFFSFLLRFGGMFLAFFAVIEVFAFFNIFLIDIIKEIMYIFLKNIQETLNTHDFLVYILFVALISFVFQCFSANTTDSEIGAVESKTSANCTDSEVGTAESQTRNLTSPQNHGDASDNAVQANADSIIEILRRSSTLGHHKDVILLGAALRQSSCLKNKNNLKIQVGHLVLESARECDDIENEAIAHIEDIGNTHLENQNVGKAIEHISAGLEAINGKIAGGNNTDALFFIAIRGYRNLANCFSFIGKENDAKTQLASAYTLAKKVTDRALYFQIMGDLKYAESKIARITSNWKHTIKYLNQSIAFYNRLCKHYSSPENERKRMESTTKNYRELGDAYCNINNYKAARDALKTGSDYAKQNLDYENLISINLTKARMANKTEPDGEGASLAITEAEKYISYVDSPKLLEKLNKARNTLLSMNKNG